MKLTYKPMRWDRISQPYSAKHKGIDLAAPVGRPIYAAAPGRVVAAGWSPWDSAGSYGRQVAIYHGGGNYTNYAHMSKIKAHLGQRVKAGDLIGYCGSSGHSTGPHLHFEVHKGARWRRVDPRPYLDKAVHVGEKPPAQKYRLLEDMNVRIGPGANYPRVGVSKWHKDDRARATKDGCLKKGSTVTEKAKVKNDQKQHWIQTRSGWICADTPNKTYLKKL